MSRESLEAVEEAGSGYSDLEFDLTLGQARLSAGTCV